jgi:asparagine synthase (glutamine-hydrolysing)
LRTFTGAFAEGAEYDESAYARSVAAACGAEEFFIYPTEADFVSLLPRLVYYMDEPAAGPGLFPQYMVSRLAATQVKVCLGGQGGDEIFGGYARYLIAYFELALRGAMFDESPEEGLGIPLDALAGNLSGVRQYAPMLTRFFRSGMFNSIDRRYFALMDRSEGMLDAYSADFRAQYDHESVFDRFKTIFDDAATPSYYNRMLHYDMQSSLPALLQVEDRVSMAVSLESRVPLLDHRIVDLIASVPPQIKFKNGQMKYLFKQAIADLVPADVFNRRDKMGFPVPLQHWARGPLREFFHDVLLSEKARQRGLFEPQVVKRLIETEGAFGRILWGMLQLELWHRCFIDGDAVAP